MLASAWPERSLAWPRKIIARIIGAVTTGYRIRLDFPDGQKVFLGPGSGTIDIALSPPTLWQTLWICLMPGLRAGESFVRGEWEVTEGDLSTFLRIIQIPRKRIYSVLYRRYSGWRGPVFLIRQKVFQEWNRRRAPLHYGSGNVLYDRMLGATGQYSCAFFSLSKSDDLEAAQQAKIATTIERLRLDRPHLRILDIGCGSGALAAELAKLPGNHEVFGITLSKEQLESALTRRANLTSERQRSLYLRLADYRDYLSGPEQTFDRIVSVGMIEHVGLGRIAHFFRSIERSLVPGGRALIHSITRPFPGVNNEWINRNIFPGSFLPSVAELIAGAEKSKLVVDAVHIHPSTDYCKTIQSWRRRFEAAWSDIQQAEPSKYHIRFKRLWTFYLAAVETTFSDDLMNFRITQIELRKSVPTVSSAE
jgi:cyclopropane-fatty-acyl-phospholipid synthase